MGCTGWTSIWTVGEGKGGEGGGDIQMHQRVGIRYAGSSPRGQKRMHTPLQPYYVATTYYIHTLASNVQITLEAPSGTCRGLVWPAARRSGTRGRPLPM